MSYLYYLDTIQSDMFDAFNFSYFLVYIILEKEKKIFVNFKQQI